MNKQGSEFSVEKYFEYHNSIYNKLDIIALKRAIDLIENKFRNGFKIITCGNGGSAYTASHYITDWNKMIQISTGLPFKGISLCDNIGLITAFGNDISFDNIFSGQLKSILDKDDLLIVISGSGNSKNILNAIDFANEKGADTLAIVGYDGGAAKAKAKYNFWVDSFDMQICEDIHLMFGHLVMKKLTDGKLY
jgi:D-sedoheptulose 7-phosphate isomerase